MIQRQFEFLHEYLRQALQENAALAIAMSAGQLESVTDSELLMNDARNWRRTHSHKLQKEIRNWRGEMLLDEMKCLEYQSSNSQIERVMFGLSNFLSALSWVDAHNRARLVLAEALPWMHGFPEPWVPYVPLANQVLDETFPGKSRWSEAFWSMLSRAGEHQDSLVAIDGSDEQLSPKVLTLLTANPSEKGVE